MSTWPSAMREALSRATYRLGDGQAQPLGFSDREDVFALRLGATEAATKRVRNRATVDLPLPDRAVLHLPHSFNVGARIDRDMPVGETYEAGRKYFGTLWMAYPFVLVDLGEDGWLELAARGPLELVGSDHGGGGLLEHLTPLRPAARVRRTEAGFVLAFEWEATDPLTIRRWPSAAEAVAHHHQWLRETYGLRSIAERIATGDLPTWVQEIPVVFTFDLWRSHGEVAHTYRHLRDLARDLKALGLPPGALFYLPGWCGPYDMGYPEYEPAPELGGRAGFREAIDALHDAGYRAMIHTLAWGADPYRAGFDRVRDLAVVAEPHHPRTRICGPYVGWPGGSPQRPLDLAVEREPVRDARRDGRGWTFETAPLPRRCEALLTLGGLDWVGGGVVRVTVNARTLTSPAGWFRDHDAYQFPFRLLLHEGTNHVGVEFFGCPRGTGGPGGPPPAFDALWYTLGDAIDLPGTWTAPIVGMNTDSPAWHEAYLDRLAQTVEEFGIDAVHVDASFIWRWDEAGFFPALRRRLPGVVFGSEGVTAAGMAFFTISQGGQVAPPDPRGAWADKLSDVPWMVTHEYLRIYQHLCWPRGFVPVGTVCNVNPVAPSLTAAEREQTAAQLARSPAFHVLYNLRVNYRDYGLDDGTREFLLSTVVGSKPGAAGALKRAPDRA